MFVIRDFFWDDASKKTFDLVFRIKSLVTLQIHCRQKIGKNIHVPTATAPSSTVLVKSPISDFVFKNKSNDFGILNLIFFLAIKNINFRVEQTDVSALTTTLIRLL